MKKCRFTDAQIMAILRQAEDGLPVLNLCREHQMSSATFYIYERLSCRKDFFEDRVPGFTSLRYLGCSICGR